MENSKLTENTSLRFGGAIDIMATTGVELVNCEISRNIGTEGAGIIQQAGDLTITNCKIDYNEGTIGGAIATRTQTSLKITNTEFIGNKASATNGGALRLSSAKNTTITNCTFTGNSSKSYGGAIAIENNSVVTLSGTTNITGNTAGKTGSGIYLGTGGTELKVKDTINIKDNANATTAGDVYLPTGKTMTIIGDLTNSNIGVLTQTKPTTENTVDVALPADGYTVDDEYYLQFFSNNDTYSTDNMIYNTNNNKVILDLGYRVTYDFDGGKIGNDTKKTVPIYPAGYIPENKIYTPERPGYTFDGWKNEVGVDVNLTTEYVDSSRTYTAKWKVKEYTVSFTTQEGATLSGNDTQNVDYGEHAASGAVSTPETEEYGFVGWSYNYTTASGIVKSGTVEDYTTIPVEGNIVFEAIIAKKPFVSVISTGNGNVSISKTGNKEPITTNDMWEIDVVTDPLPVNAVIKDHAATGYVLNKITFQDLYGNAYEVDIKKSTEQDFEVGETGEKSTVKITYDKANKKLFINGIETTQKYKYEYREKDDNKIIISNNLKGNMADVLTDFKYTVTGTIDEVEVTKEYYLKSGESITLDGFDTGTEYKIIQEELTDYESSVNCEVENIQTPTKENLTVKGTFNSQGTVTTNYTNLKSLAPNTGIEQINSETIIAIIATAALLVLILIKFKKKNTKNN